MTRGGRDREDLEEEEEERINLMRQRIFHAILLY
jgi:hypothetical protein